MCVGGGAMHVHIDGGCTFALWHPEIIMHLKKHALNKVVACLMYKHVELYPLPLFIYRLLITHYQVMFLLIEDRTLRSLQVMSDEASVLEFCWTVSIVIYTETYKSHIHSGEWYIV